MTHPKPKDTIAFGRSPLKPLIKEDEAGITGWINGKPVFDEPDDDQQAYDDAKDDLINVDEYGG